MSCVLCKVFDYIILQRYSDKLSSSNLQFAFKGDHSTSQCTALVKEVVLNYISKGSDVYCCALDMSKAFDRLDFIKLFNVLLTRNIPPIMVRCILDLYVNQQMQAEWCGELSDPFSVTNGSRQGQVSSPLYFCIYLDKLLNDLQDSKIGCHLGNRFLACFAYADDIILLAPTLTGLNNLVKICEKYGKDYNVIFNEQKTECIRFSSKGTLFETNFIKLNNKPLQWKSTIKHLGNMLSMNMSDKVDIEFKMHNFFSSVNRLIAKFPGIDLQVRSKLFSTYCTSFYGCQTWCLNSKMLQPLVTGWNKCVRKLLHLPPNTHCNLLSPVLNVDSFECCHAKRMARFISTGIKSKNENIAFIFNRALLLKTGSIGHSSKELYSVYNISNSNLKNMLYSNLKYQVNIHYRASTEIQHKVEMIKDILDGTIRGFSDEELQDILTFICTS